MTLKTANILLGLVVAALAARELAARLSPTPVTAPPPVVAAPAPVSTPVTPSPAVDDAAPLDPDAAARARAGFESREYCDPDKLAAAMLRDRWPRVMRDAAPMMAAASCLDVPRR